MSNWKKRHIVVPAVYVVLKKGDEVLLLKRHNTGYRDGEFSMPAGHLEGNEAAIAAAVREAKEEIAVDIKEEALRLVHVQHRIAEERDHERINIFFEAVQWQGEPVNAEPEKCSGLVWADINKLPENMVPELVHLFKHYKKGELYGHFGFN